MANATGRPISPLVLSADDGPFLSASGSPASCGAVHAERCRIILRCADGLPSKSVAAELGVHEHTVGKWRRRFEAAR